jgi:two-component system, NarL family, response regulator NreC
MSKIRVLLVDDHTLLRGGLRALLGYYDDIEVVGEAQDGKEALARVSELRPDIVLMDIVMPGMNGLEATKLIHEQYPMTRIIILTQHEDRRFVLSLYQVGASGYVLKRALETDLIAALRTVAQGGTFVDPTLAMAVLPKTRRTGEGQTTLAASLTPREHEILVQIVRGKTSAQIAASLFLSGNTVEWHRTNLMNKLGIHKATDLVRYALDNGLVELNE